MTQSVIIRVRRASGDAYAASGGGQRATCAWSPMEAVRRCANKHFDEPRLVKLDDAPGDSEAGVLYRFRAEHPESCRGCGCLGGGHCPDCGPVMGDSTYQEFPA